jgi:uncharacterized membrane protein YheB (UPF0754 family)
MLAYLLMPVVAAAIGWVTKLVAVEMLFRPLEFRGIRPVLGWQGIVPRHGSRMATVAVDLMLSRLISTDELLAKLDPDELLEQLHRPLTEGVDELTREVMVRYHAQLWESLPEPIQQLVIERVQAQAPAVARRMVDDLRERFDRILDLRATAVEAILRDPALTVRLIREVAQPELRFLVRAGLLFGFLLGLVQAAVWALTGAWWVMPAFGALVGYSTDWLTLQMIFRPVRPARYLGFLRWQGMFHRRREEVAVDYSHLIATEVLTARNVLRALLEGPQSDRLFALVRREVERAVDAQQGLARPLVVFAMGADRYRSMKQDAAQLVIARLPEAAREIEGYATERLDVGNLLIRKIRLLGDEEYENLLRPAFKQDEWKLIAVGAALGFLIGELQVVLLLH